jgi:hypothetical protein
MRGPIPAAVSSNAQEIEVLVRKVVQEIINQK